MSAAARTDANETRVTVADGKYTFICRDDGSQEVLRYGGQWWTPEEGSNAIRALVHHASRTDAALDALAVPGVADILYRTARMPVIGDAERAALVTICRIAIESSVAVEHRADALARLAEIGAGR